MPRRDRLGRHPHRQAAAIAQRGVVLPPVLHPVSRLWDPVTAGFIMLVRHQRIIVTGPDGVSSILLRRPTHPVRDDLCTNAMHTGIRITTRRMMFLFK